MPHKLPSPTCTPDFCQILDDLGQPSNAAIAKALGISVRTVQTYRRENFAPRPVLLALFWLTRWGRSAANADAENQAKMMYSQAMAEKSENRRLRAQLAQLARIADFGCANDAGPAIPSGRALWLRHQAPRGSRPVRVTIPIAPAATASR
ncbi:hypothetical protein [Roseateles microcysteis]|uniref:hypothetical protein n=1 Tax=Roseateles microcysteis TaxID=3119057 RepID=UPI002FE63B17